jgi:putative SOS response-associated peptidase YedK
MCGRFTLTASGEEIADAFGLDEPPVLAPRYNIAPSQEIAAVLSGADGRRRFEVLRWGFVPAKDGGRPIINARSETAWSRGVFKDAFARRRCLLPADGFFEWAEVPGASKRQPYHLRLREGRLFGLGAIWEPSADGRGTCAILTTEPTDAIRAIHDRMPVVIPRRAYGDWLDPTKGKGALTSLLGPFEEVPFDTVAVSFAVNDTGYDGPICIRPAS